MVCVTILSKGVIVAKILIVDDSSFQRKWIAKAVQELGHNAVEASDGVDGLNKLDSEKPDCITIDLNMPNMNGLQFLERTVSKNASIPIVVVTADIQDATKKQCVELGARAFVNKPFRPEDLQNVISECLTMPNSEETTTNG